MVIKATETRSAGRAGRLRCFEFPDQLRNVRQIGTYELQFLCEGPSGTELSVASWSGVEVVAPVQVHCNGNIFKTTVQLEAGADRVDFKMNPGSGGSETRYAFRLVPPT